MKLRTSDEARQKLNKLRSMYEPYVHSTARNLMVALPPWRHPAKTRDNWQAGPWDRMIQAKGLAVLGHKARVQSLRDGLVNLTNVATWRHGVQTIPAC